MSARKDGSYKGQVHGKMEDIPIWLWISYFTVCAMDSYVTNWNAIDGNMNANKDWE